MGTTVTINVTYITAMPMISVTISQQTARVESIKQSAEGTKKEIEKAKEAGDADGKAKAEKKLEASKRNLEDAKKQIAVAKGQAAVISKTKVEANKAKKNAAAAKNDADAVKEKAKKVIEEVGKEKGVETKKEKKPVPVPSKE